MENPWLTSLGLYGFLIAYAIYMLFTYRVDPKYRLNYEKPPSFKRLLWLSSFEKLAFLLLLVVFALTPQRDLFTVFSIDRITFSFPIISLGVLSGVLIFFGGMPINFLISAIRRKFSIQKTRRELELGQLLATSMSTPSPNLFPNVFVASVLVGVLEEIIFRGYLLAHLSNLALPIIAAILLQAIFAFIPQLYQGVYNALLSLYGGILFGIVFLLFGSLLAVIVAHLTHDIVGFVFTFPSRKKKK